MTYQQSLVERALKGLKVQKIYIGIKTIDLLETMLKSRLKGLNSRLIPIQVK